MAARVLEHLPKTIFIIAGSGDMERHLMSQAAELGIADHVLFVGFLRGHQIEEAYRMADLFVVPSVSEPFGLTVLESMAHGTPVIVSKQSGVSEIVSHALKVDFWDTEAMADKVIAILRHQPLRQQLSEYGQRETEHFSWRAAARKCLDLFHRVMRK
jgi:glycosyltransferase involved in cell wall biosynthesis